MADSIILATTPAIRARKARWTGRADHITI